MQINYNIMNDFNKITSVFKTLSDKINLLEQNKDNISLLEIDLIKDHIKKLYELLSELQFSPQANYNQQFTHHTEPKLDNDMTSDNILQSPVINIEDIPIVEEKNLNPHIEVKVKDKTSPETLSPKKIEKQADVSNKIITDTSLFSNEELTTISEKLDDKKPSINEKISKQKVEKNIADKINNASNLKDLIGINDKFLFINELFNGDKQAYDEFIDKLSKATDASISNNIIKDSQSKYNWKEDSEAYIKLIELISSKF